MKIQTKYAAQGRDLRNGSCCFPGWAPGPFRAAAGSGWLPRPQGPEGYDPSASTCPTCRNVHNVRPLLRLLIYKPSRPVPRAASNTGFQGKQERKHAALPADTVLFSQSRMAVAGRTM